MSSEHESRGRSTNHDGPLPVRETGENGMAPGTGNGMKRKARVRYPGGAGRRALEHVRVELLRSEPLRLRCRQCATVWEPYLGERGWKRPGYWICPSRCNDPGRGAEG